MPSAGNRRALPGLSIPQLVGRRGHIRVLGPMAAIILLGLLPAAPASAAEKRAVIFEPAETTAKAVTFRLHGVSPRSVLRGALVRDGKVRRRIGRERARRVVDRGLLRVPVRSSTSR